MPSPLISVILPVYNRENYLNEAIQSMLEQTYKNFELIIVDDGSTDNSLSIAENINDERIVICKNQINKGVSFSRNLGISKAKGEFLAFMDSDDISLPLRLEKQILLFQNNKEIDICGSWLQMMNSKKILDFAKSHDEIICRMLLHCAISIGSVMARATVFKDERFNSELRHGEDYELWSRLCWKKRFHNIQEPLLIYRYHANQLSIINKQEQSPMDVQIRLNLFHRFNYNKAKFTDGMLTDLFLYNNALSFTRYINIIEWFEEIKEQNYKQQIFQKKYFNMVIKQMKKDLIYKTFFVKHFKHITKNMKFKILFHIDLLSIVYIIKMKGRERLKLSIK